MKLQLDTTNKTIKLESNIKLSELVSTLEKLLPKGEWKTFTLEANTSITTWYNPIVIKEYPTHPTYPWYVTTTTNTVNYSLGDCKLKAGVYDIETN